MRVLALTAYLALTATAIELEDFEDQYHEMMDAHLAQLEAEADQRVIDGPEDINYFRSDEYQAMTAREKFDLLWTEITADDTMQEYLWKETDQIFTQKANSSFCIDSDELKKNRLKTSHTQGLVAHVSWVPEADNIFTGAYAEGTDIGIMRLSETGYIIDTSSGLHPSMALKFLHTGIRSSNLFGMASFHRSDSWDFFANTLRNRVEPFDQEKDQLMIQTIQKKLSEAHSRPFMTAVSIPARYGEDGLLVDDWVTPFTIEYEVAIDPADYGITDAKEFDADGNQVAWYTQLQRIPAGTTLYNVYGITNPEGIETAVYGATVERIKMATIKLESELLTSKFGDDRLNFQHGRFAMDAKFQRKWKHFETYIDKYNTDNTWLPNHETIPLPDDNDAARAIIEEGLNEHGCPFAWLLGLVDV